MITIGEVIYNVLKEYGDADVSSYPKLSKFVLGNLTSYFKHYFDVGHFFESNESTHKVFHHPCGTQPERLPEFFSTPYGSTAKHAL